VLATTPISALLGDQAAPPVVLHRDTWIDGNVTAFELDVIASLVRAHRPGVVFEIGTFDGRTTLNMAANAAEGAIVYTLDLPAAAADATAFALELNEDIFIRKPRSGARFVDSRAPYNIVQLFGDSATFDFSPFRGRVDFMFIDGSHAYEYVRSDTLAALSMVREGGTIIWHDYVREGFTPFPGVPRALKEFYLTDARFRALAQIEQTSIVHLRLPAGAPPADFCPALLGDSTRSDHLRGRLEVWPLDAPTETSVVLPIRIVASNTGAATWLASDAPVGPVRVGARVLNPRGEMLDNDYWRAELPFRRATFPGETVTFEAEIRRPGPDACILDFDLVAEGVAWFNVAPPARIPLPGGVQ
jgi:predicted O-methyltransferase YrrM